MRTSFPVGVGRLIAGGVLITPGMAAAHAGNHLHFWGSHGAEGQVMLVGGALAGLAAFGIWLWHRHR